MAFSVANGEDDDEDERGDDAEDDELHLHVLEPHLAPYPGALLPEIVGLLVEHLRPRHQTIDLSPPIHRLTYIEKINEQYCKLIFVRNH